MPAPNSEGSKQARIFSGGSERESFNIILQTSPAKRHSFFKKQTTSHVACMSFPMMDNGGRSE